MPYWQRLVVLGAVVIGSFVVARLIDLRMRRRQLAAGTVTRYGVLRRSIIAGIVTVALLSGLLVIPQVRTVAGALLASGAVIGLVFGFAAQRPLANFAAGILIAITQPLRLGDRIAIDGVEGTVEEIRLTHTFVRADDESRLVIPNEKLASDTIRNSTIVDRAQRAEVTVRVPLGCDLDTAVDALSREFAGRREPHVFVSGLSDGATITIRALADDPDAARELEHELLLRAHRCLRAAGAWQ
jgi:small-conductance mechanosensitive channel